MGTDPVRGRSCGSIHLAMPLTIGLGLLALAPVADAQEKNKSKSIGAFGEGRRGDVPEGTLEMLTPETDRAIQNGLAWLARSQNADGSFGSGTYRGNIAVTSLAGLAFMAGGFVTMFMMSQILGLGRV